MRKSGFRPIFLILLHVSNSGEENEMMFNEIILLDIVSFTSNKEIRQRHSIP
jgi:hypothetical protein